MDTISRNIKITRKELKNVTADVFNTNMTKTFIMIFMIAVMILFFIVMSVDKQALGVRFASYLATFIVVILSGFLVLFSEIKGHAIYFIIFVLSLAIVTLVFNKEIFRSTIFRTVFDFFWREYPSYVGLSKEASFVVTYSLKMLLFTIILLGLSIIYNAFLNKAYQQSGTTGLIVQLIFYIPCLISDFIKYLINDLYDTPTVVYIMLGLELLLIVAYFLIPKLLKVSVAQNGAVLVRNPVFLNNRNALDNCGAVMNKYMKDVDALGIPTRLHGVDASGNRSTNAFNSRPSVTNREYAFSMWINANSVPNTEYNIFFCGTNDNNKNVVKGKPLIRYIKDTYDNDKYKYEFTFTDISSSSTYENYKTQLPAQKWNHIVLNYHHNKCDLFINGEITYTVKFNNENIPSLGANETNILTIGNKDDGVSGDTVHAAICNVMIYRKALTIQQVINTYNLYQFRNPPV